MNQSIREEYADIIRQNLGSQFSRVNEAALFALGNVGSKADAELLSTWASMRNPYYGFAASAALLDLCVPDAGQRISEILTDYPSDSFIHDEVRRYQERQDCE
jgi:hypothetical protein